MKLKASIFIEWNILNVKTNNDNTMVYSLCYFTL